MKPIVIDTTGGRKPVPPERAWIFPSRAHEGDRIVIRLAKPLPQPVVPRILIGDRPLAVAMLRDSSTVIGLVPADKPGDKKVVVAGDARGAKGGAFVHLGKRAPAEGPWRRLTHYRLKGGTVASAFAGGKPADPTRPGSNWWMAGGGLYRDADAHVAASPPVAPAWQFTASLEGTAAFSEPVLSDDTLIVAPETFPGEGETLVALDAATGARRWTWEMTGTGGRIDSTPLCVNGRVYAAKLVSRVNALGALHLLCADAGNGSILWEREVGPPTWHSFMALAAAHGMIYALTFDGALRAFDALSGDLAWEQIGAVPLTQYFACDQSITVAFGKLFAGSTTGLKAFDPQTGMPVDFSPIAFNCSASPVVVSGGTARPLVFAGTDTGIINAFNAQTHEHLWQFAGEHGPQYYWPRMACDSARLYVQQQRTVVALDLATGAPLATSPTLGLGTCGAPIVCGNRVFQIAWRQSAPGGSSLYGLKPADLSIVEEIPLRSEAIVTRPAMAAGFLYVNDASDDAHWTMANALRALRVGP